MMSEDPESTACGEGVPSPSPVPENVVDPTQWPLWRKWSIVVCIALMYMLAYVSSPRSHQVLVVLTCPATSERSLLCPASPGFCPTFTSLEIICTNPLFVSIWELGEGVGSFLVGPLSEQ